jgi:hypothetical protein
MTGLLEVVQSSSNGSSRSIQNGHRDFDWATVRAVLPPNKLERAGRISAACLEAIERLEAIPVSVAAPGLFGAVGEAVMWLAALDDLLRHSDAQYELRRSLDPGGALLPGIRFARNVLTHGHAVAGVTALRPGSELGMLMLGVSQLGTVSRVSWVERSQIPHIVRKARTSVSEEQSYEQSLAGRDPVPTLQAALQFVRNEAGA